MHPSHTSAPTTGTGDEIALALDRLDLLLAGIRRDAGNGAWPEYERGLAACLRVLRALGADAGEVTQDLADAARSALETAQPEAPLRMLDVSRQSLGAALRQAQWAPRKAA